MKKARKLSMLLLVALLASYLYAPTAIAGDSPLLVIFHTNDVHGYAFEERDGDGKLTRLGYDRFKAVTDAEDAKHKMLLDAGDVLHGQAFATARRGELMAAVLGLVGYDALAAGNHDFDYGYDRLLALRDKYRLNFTARNVVRKDGGSLILPPYIIKEFEDLKVGVFGLSTPETVITTDPRNISALRFDDPITSAKEAVRQLKEAGVDLIVAVTHMGSESYCKPMSQTIAREVPGIDLIVDGHSHSELSGLKVNDTLIVSTGSYFKNIGRVVVDRKPEGGFTLSARLTPASDFGDVNPDPAMSAAMNALKEELNKELSVVVTRVPFDLDGARQNVRRRSTNLGRLVCAALMSGTGADVAIVNGGSIRDSIASGDVTKGALLTVLPYGNYVYTVEITGEELLTTLNHGLALPGAGGFPQFYGAEVTAETKEVKDANGAAVEILVADSVKVGGKPLAKDARYTVAINDFMYAGGDGYNIFGRYDYHEFFTLEEMLKQFIAESDVSVLQAVDRAEVLIIKGK